MKKASKQDFWFEHIKCCQNSSLTQKEYCNQEGLNFNTFIFWRMKFINQKNDKTSAKKSISFIPAIVKSQPIENPHQNGNGLTVVLPNQIKLSLSNNLVFDELLALVRTLGSLS